MIVGFFRNLKVIIVLKLKNKNSDYEVLYLFVFNSCSNNCYIKRGIKTGMWVIIVAHKCFNT